MANEMPSGRTLDSDFMFTKLSVSELDRAARFYGSVFGLVEMHRVEAQIVGQAVNEVVYMGSYPGGPLLVLMQFPDAPPPGTGEVMLGFSTQDLDAFVERLEMAGGRLLDITQDAMFRVAFAEDPEGHKLEITQPIA